MIEIKSPTRHVPAKGMKIFLAGSIEMGSAENWQTKITEEFKNYQVVFLNPRRDDWDSSWEQTIDNDNFVDQVEWELDMLENSDLIIMYFDPNTKSPISLLEFGMFAKSEKMVVCCPEGFWRKGNVDVVCTRNFIPLTETIENLIEYIRRVIVLKNDEYT